MIKLKNKIYSSQNSDRLIDWTIHIYIRLSKFVLFLTIINPMLNWILTQLATTLEEYGIRVRSHYKFKKRLYTYVIWSKETCVWFRCTQTYSLFKPIEVKLLYTRAVQPILISTISAVIIIKYYNILFLFCNKLFVK